MRKLIAAINITIDGYCDHTAVIAQDELHRHYTELLNSADTILYGRVTFQLMEYWKSVLENPTWNKTTDEFAVAMDRIPKIVFSRTLKTIDWNSASLAKRDLKEEVLELRQQRGGDILVGSPGLILALTQLELIDEYQLCVHPVIAGGGRPLFRDIDKKRILKLIKTKPLGYGPVTLYYSRVKE